MVLYDIHMKLEGPVIFSEMDVDMAVIFGNRMQLVLHTYYRRALLFRGRKFRGFRGFLGLPRNLFHRKLTEIISRHG